MCQCQVVVTQIGSISHGEPEYRALDKSHTRPVGNEIAFGCRCCGNQMTLTLRANVALAQTRLKVVIFDNFLCASNWL